MTTTPTGRLAGLGINQREIIRVIAQNGGACTHRDLTDALRGTKESSIYQALNSLEERQLIVRERYPRPQPTILRLGARSAASVKPAKLSQEEEQDVSTLHRDGDGRWRVGRSDLVIVRHSKDDWGIYRQELHGEVRIRGAWSFRTLAAARVRAFEVAKEIGHV